MSSGGIGHSYNQYILASKGEVPTISYLGGRLIFLH